MGNEIQTQNLKRALQERERLLIDNAEWIAGRVATLLEHYYQPDQDDAVLAAATGDWVEILGGLQRDLIQKACIRYMQEEPRRRPTPGAIYQIAREMIPPPTEVRRDPPPPPERKEPRVTPEQRAKMVEEAGVTDPLLRKVLRGEGMGE